MRFLDALPPVAGLVALAASLWAAAPVPQAPSAAPDPDQLFARALALHKAGDLKGAAQAYENFLSVQPEAVEAISNLGAIYARLGDYGKAIQQYGRALELAPGNAGIRFNLALAYYETGQTPKALEEFGRVMAADPSNPRAALLAADCHFRLGDYKRVIQLLEPLEKTQPENRALLYLLGTALIRENQSARGLAMVDRILRNGESAEAHLMLGIGRMMTLDNPGALKEFERAIELSPKIPNAHTLAGQCLLNLNENGRALEEFQRELALNPNDYDANVTLGMLLRKDGKLDEAFPYLERALRVRPGAPDARYQLASAQLAAGKTAEAQAALERLVREHPDFREAHVTLATVYYRANRKTDGDRERDIVRELDAKAKTQTEGRVAKAPTPAAPASTFEELAAQAGTAREAGRSQEAIELYRKALARKADWAEGWWQLGALHYSDDRYRDAYEAFTRLVSLKPNGGPGWGMLGLCEFQLKEYEKALVHLQQGRLLGLGKNTQLTRVARFHVAILLNRFQQPEAADKLLEFMARDDERQGNPPSPAVTVALGLAALQLPLLPSEIPPDQADLVSGVGQAQHAIALRSAAKANELFEALLARFPKAPGLRYCYAVHLLAQDPDRALAEFRRELELSPQHVKVRLQLAVEMSRRGDYRGALPFAEQALQLAPKLFAARNTIAKVLLGLGQVERAIREAEIGVKLAPDSPETFYTLARAYAAAGRKEDAARARAEFSRLDREWREQENPRNAPSPGETEQPPASNGGGASHPQLTTNGQRP